MSNRVKSLVTYNNSGTFPNGWLAFELNVLRRLKFSSIALPFSGESDLCMHLKRWRVRVAANDPLLWAFIKATALVENHSEQLVDDDIDTIVSDAYVPRDKLDNPALLKWFNETDAWWFDNVRFNSERLRSPYKRALALTVGMMVGDYVLSFGTDTRNLRRPLSLSNVFRQLRETLPYPYDNALRNKSTNQDPQSFIAERYHTDLLFLRLPAPVIQSEATTPGRFTWREEWLRGGDDFWVSLEQQQAGKLGAAVQSKKQYLRCVEDLLRTAAHIRLWAIAHTENGFISSDELSEVVGQVRKVGAVYTKDFSDLLGVRSSLITAGN